MEVHRGLKVPYNLLAAEGGDRFELFLMLQVNPFLIEDSSNRSLPQLVVSG